MKVEEKDFVYEWYSGTGPGGQHRNKTQNCCRCRHEPTGIQATGARSRSREENKRSAYIAYLSKIKAHLHLVSFQVYYRPNDKIFRHT